jgi:hypothetical protein
LKQTTENTEFTENRTRGNIEIKEVIEADLVLAAIIDRLEEPVSLAVKEVILLNWIGIGKF